MDVRQEISKYDEVLYLLQGGGALGAYQVGVLEELLTLNCDPTWIIGTSIGGINGAIIAGNKPEQRIPKLKQFWNKISVFMPDLIPEFLPDPISEQLRAVQNLYVSDWAAMFGVNGFFKPRLSNPWLERNSTPDKLSYYDTAELRKTLEEIIDFNLLNSPNKIRLTVTAICVETGGVVRFDNNFIELKPEHIMATGALPPGLPAIKIDGKYYWDGGVSSNTPFEVILEEPIINSVLCFVVNLFSYIEKAPNSMPGILKRRKDLEFISRHHSLLHYICEMQNYQKYIQKLVAKIPNAATDPEVQQIVANQHPITLNIARFHYRDKPYDIWTKDYEFSKKSLDERIKLGMDDVQKAFAEPSWLELKPEEIQLHNF